MKGVLNAMFVKKLKLMVGAVVVMAALGVVGLAYREGTTSGTAQAAPPDKPLTELEILRKENESLKLNLQIVLEKVRSLEAAVSDLRSRQPGATGGQPGGTPSAQYDNADRKFTDRVTGSQPGRTPSGFLTPPPAAPQQELLKQRLALAKEFVAQAEQGYQKGAVPWAEWLRAKEAVFKAELDLCESDKERIAVLEKMVAWASQYEEIAAKMVPAGQNTPSALLEAKLRWLEAEIALQRAKQK
jgi:hypothetical protein